MKALESQTLPLDASNESDRLLETLQKEGAKRRQMTRVTKLMLASMAALLLVGIVSDWMKGKPFDFAYAMIFGSFLFGGCAYGLTPELRAAVTRASGLTDLRLLGGMIEALDAGEPSLRETLEEALAVRLEQVTAKDLGLVDGYQLDRLIEAVRRSNNRRFCLAAVQALGRIGSARTLQGLEVLIHDPSMAPSRRSECAPYIREAMAELRIRLARERLTSGEFEPPTGLASVRNVATRLKDELSDCLQMQTEDPEARSKRQPGSAS